MTPGQRIRQAANLINLSTPLGMLIAKLGHAWLAEGPRGLLIASGFSLPLPHAAAFTVGNVVLYRTGREIAGADAVLLSHEEKHSTQYAWCLGLPFFPLYLASAGWSLLRTGNPASRNFFERRAGLAAGGYQRGAGSIKDSKKNNDPRDGDGKTQESRL